jgi:uncharacterized protein (UPF0332 family)
VTTWEEMSRDSFIAAQKLLRENHYRSSVSRSYYAAYCAVTGVLTRRKVSFPKGWNNPTHVQVVSLIKAHLRLFPGKQRQLGHALKFLRLGREDADYRPGKVVDRKEGIQYLKEAALVRKILELHHEK